MRRKRLQHVADNLCQMFCGWRQIFSKRRLVELGSGVLVLDVLHERCAFQGAPIEPLPILAELRAWMARDLAEHRIPLDAIDQAEVEAHLTFSTIEWAEYQGSEQWFLPNHAEVTSGPMYRCHMDCSSLIRSGDAIYRGARKETEEWPFGWPAA
jgi:hypothetical protein